MITRGHEVPLTRQCDLPNLSRSGIYYMPVGMNETGIGN
jgi:hypothetical protein